MDAAFVFLVHHLKCVFSVSLLTPITLCCQHVHWVDITERRPAVGLGREKKSHLVLPGTLYINMHTHS